MSTIPSNIARVPNSLSTRLTLGNLQRGNLDLLRITEQLSTTKRLNRPSDNPIDASLVSVLNSRINASEQRQRNIDHAGNALNTLDQALGDMHDLVLDAKTLASSQIGVGSDAATRANTALVIDSILRELNTVSQADFSGMHLFSGQRTGVAPIQSLFDGYRYVGSGDGQRTELGGGLDIPITIGADRALGALSARVRGDVDLNPLLTEQTALADLGGARGLGVAPGAMRITVDNGTAVSAQVDLSRAQSVGDALRAIESAIRAIDPAALDGAFPAGVAISPDGQRISVDAAAGYMITFDNPGGGTIAADLGLAGFGFAAGAEVNPAGDLDARLTPLTTFGQLDPAGGFTPGDIVFRNGGRTGTVTVTAGMTIEDFAREVDKLGLGLRVEIDPSGRTLNVFNEVSGWDMSIEESGGGTLTATGLGIRTLKGTTPTGELNDGRGVEIAHGVVSPLTGLPDAARNTDFRVTLTDGRTFDVDLEPDDLVSMDALLAKINASAAGATPPIGVPGEFEAHLADGANGLVLTDSTGGAGTLRVEQLNGRAAEDLGLLDAGGVSGSPAVLAGSDRSSVRVESVLSALVALRDALEADDERGIVFAAGALEGHLDRLVSARAEVGGRAQRVESARVREEDTRLLDETVRSGLEDVDFVEASTRFSLLQLAQQAGYAATAQSLSLTLLNFLR